MILFFHLLSIYHSDFTIESICPFYFGFPKIFHRLKIQDQFERSSNMGPETVFVSSSFSENQFCLGRIHIVIFCKMLSWRWFSGAWFGERGGFYELLWIVPQKSIWQKLSKEYNTLQYKVIYVYGKYFNSNAKMNPWIHYFGNYCDRRCVWGRDYRATQIWKSYRSRRHHLSASFATQDRWTHHLLLDRVGLRAST